MQHNCPIGLIRDTEIFDLNDPLIALYADAIAEFNIGAKTGPKHPGPAVPAKVCDTCSKPNANGESFKRKLVQLIDSADRRAAANPSALYGAAKRFVAAQAKRA